MCWLRCPDADDDANGDAVGIFMFRGFQFVQKLPACLSHTHTHVHAHNNNDNNKYIIIKSGQQHCTHTFYSSSLTRTQLVAAAAAAGSASGSVLDRSVHLVSSKCMSIQFRICPKILIQPSPVSQSLHSLPSASLPTPARRQRWRSLSIVFFSLFFSKQLRASPEASFLRRFFAPYLGGVNANVAELGWANDWGTFCASSGGSTTYLNALIYLQSYVLWL